MTRIVRCKFRCDTITKQVGELQSGEMLYKAIFAIVTGGSKENEEFFKWTPSGQLQIGLYKEDIFQPGKEYYIDITEAITEVK